MKYFISSSLLLVVSLFFSGCSSTPVETVATANVEPVVAMSPKTLNAVLFEVDKADLNQTAHSYLKEAAQMLKGNASWSLTAAAFCDSTGSKAHNIKLGEKRANSVKGYLTAQGVSDSQINLKNNCAMGGNDRKAELNIK